MESVSDKSDTEAPRPDPARVEAALAKLRSADLTAKQWAEANGESPALTWKVLSGQRPCIMGASRRIAIKLGIIDGSVAGVPAHA